MDDRNKEILFDMVFKKILETVKIPRGSGKSVAYIYMACQREAVRRTNYILAAIGEKYEPTD